MSANSCEQSFFFLDVAVFDCYKNFWKEEGFPEKKSHIWQRLEEKWDSMLNNYRKNLKYTYKMLYPGVKFSLFFGLPVFVLLIGFYVLSKYMGVRHAELKLIITGIILLLLPFGFITVYSLSKKREETWIRIKEIFKRFLRLSPYFLSIFVFIVAIYIVISLILKFVFGISFLN
jgi:hypothetical protein